MNQDDRFRIIRNTSIIGIIGNTLISGIKLFSGFVTGSLAVIGDGIDSATDILTSIITLVTAKISCKPPDKEHPYGHNRAETIATKLLSFIITFAGVQLFVKTVGMLIKNESAEIPGKLAVIATIISLVGKILLAVHKTSVGKKVKSQMMIADGKNMQNDILISSIVLLGLFFTNHFNLPVIDRVMALGISLFIIKVGFEIFWETSDELMDGLRDTAIYRDVFEAVNLVEGVSNPHRARIRKMNNYYLIDLDIEVDPDITVKTGHEIASRVEKSIREHIESVYDVMIHIEPNGSHEPGEKFGLSADDIPSV